MTPAEAAEVLKHHKTYKRVLFPFLITDDLIGGVEAKPIRYVIDFQRLDVADAQAFVEPFARVKKTVLPDRKAAYEEEDDRNKLILVSVRRVLESYESFVIQGKGACVPAPRVHQARVEKAV